MNLVGPNDVCELFGISKATLLRWEREGVIRSPMRDSSGHREYDKELVLEIAAIHLKRLTEQYSQASKTENEKQLARIHHAVRRLKFVQGDIRGTYELVAEDTDPHAIAQYIGLLLLLYEPDSSFFARSMSIFARELLSDECKGPG